MSFALPKYARPFANIISASFMLAASALLNPAHAQDTAPAPKQTHDCNPATYVKFDYFHGVGGKIEVKKPSDMTSLPPPIAGLANVFHLGEIVIKRSAPDIYYTHAGYCLAPDGSEIRFGSDEAMTPELIESVLTNIALRISNHQLPDGLRVIDKQSGKVLSPSMHSYTDFITTSAAGNTPDAVATAAAPAQPTTPQFMNNPLGQFVQFVLGPKG